MRPLELRRRFLFDSLAASSCVRLNTARMNRTSQHRTRFRGLYMRDGKMVRGPLEKEVER